MLFFLSPDCYALILLYSHLILKAAAVVCDLVIMLMSCNKDILHLAFTSNASKIGSSIVSWL